MALRPVRLAPGADLRRSLEELSRGGEAAFVVAGIGSLVDPAIRFADASDATRLSGPFEILTLSGSLAGNGAHLHITVADDQGCVFGGHVAYGNEVRTTAEVLLAGLPEWSLQRAPDGQTGYDELVVRARDAR